MEKLTVKHSLKKERICLWQITSNQMTESQDFSSYVRLYFPLHVTAHKHKIRILTGTHLQPHTVFDHPSPLSACILTSMRDWFTDYKIPVTKPTNRFGLGNVPAIRPLILAGCAPMSIWMPFVSQFLSHLYSLATLFLSHDSISYFIHLNLPSINSIYASPNSHFSKEAPVHISSKQTKFFSENF